MGGGEKKTSEQILEYGASDRVWGARSNRAVSEKSGRSAETRERSFSSLSALLDPVETETRGIALTDDCIIRRRIRRRTDSPRDRFSNARDGKMEKNETRRDRAGEEDRVTIYTYILYNIYVHIYIYIYICKIFCEQGFFIYFIVISA